MRYLAIGAHPDDLELRCFGTLAKLRSMGHTIGVCNICNGSLGHKSIPPAELVVIRQKEAAAAAQIIGATHYTANVDDMTLDRHNQEYIRRVAEIIRKFKPDVIFTNDPNDYHPDHIEASWLVFHASFSSSLPNYSTDSANHPLVPILYYFDTARGLHFEPTEFVDISEYMDLRMQSFLCHKSQIEWLQSHTHVNMIEKIKIHAAFRGYQCGVDYAEAFRLCSASLRVSAQRILP